MSRVVILVSFVFRQQVSYHIIRCEDFLEDTVEFGKRLNFMRGTMNFKCVCKIVRSDYLLACLFTYLLTYLLTPCSRSLLEKLAGFQLVKKFPALYGIRRFITAFTIARHMTLY